MYDFLNRIHVCGRSAAHAVRGFSLIVLLTLGLTPLAFSQSYLNQQCGAPSQGYCDAVYPGTNAQCGVANGLACGRTICVNNSAVTMAILPGQSTPSETNPVCISNNGNTCIAQNDTGALFIQFAQSTQLPQDSISNVASMTFLSEAFSALPQTLSVCHQGCVHSLIPYAADPYGAYASRFSPFKWYRAYDSDRANTSCTGPGNAGTHATHVPVTESSVEQPGSSTGHGNGTGTGGATACAPGDTRAACATLDTVQNESIPGVTVTLPGFASETQHFGSGQCPANVFMTFHGINKNLKVWDWQQACQTMVTYVKPVVLVLGAIVALFIVLGIPMPTQSNDQGA